MTIIQNLDAKVQLGLRAHELATRHTIADRLPEGMLDELLNDVQALQELMSMTPNARREITANTAARLNTLRRAHALVRGVRFLVRKAGVPTDVRKRYGVGVHVHHHIYNQVVTVLEQILGRIEEAPPEAAHIGIVAEDVTNLRAALAEIRASDAEQRQSRIEGPKATAKRTAAARRITVAVGRIVAAGLTRFANQPAAAAFAALDRGPTRRKNRPSDAPQAEDTTTAEAA